jgi:peptidoglycan/xylan/chitin deacetylase (PgdA/CDA1 family)
MLTTIIFSLQRLFTRFFNFWGLSLLWLAPTALFAMSTPLAESPGAAASQTDSSSHAVVLVYHHFADETPASTSIRPQQFERQLDYLEDQGFELLTLGKVIEAFENGEALPEKTLVLTADDAYRSVYTYAFPALQKRGWAMTVFANTQPIEQHYRSHMTWAQLAEMQAAGFEIANHGHTHDTMVRTPDETHQAWSKRLQNDINTAQTLLAEHLPQPPPKLLAYPYGEYSLAVKQKIREMGYVGVSQHSGAINAQSDHGALLRFPVNTEFGGMERFDLITHTRPLPVKTLTPADTLVEQNPPSLTLTFHNAMTQAQQNRLQCFNQQGDSLTLNWNNAQSVTMTQTRPLAPPRNRYACTQQTDDGQFRWFSHLWMLPGFHSVGN